MSIILQRGDKIHLAIGADHQQGVVDYEGNIRIAREVMEIYTRQGVEVVTVTVVTTTAGPVIPTVVAVFREPKKASDLVFRGASPLPVYDSLDDLKVRDPNPERGRTVMVGDLRYVSINGEWVQV